MLRFDKRVDKLMGDSKFTERAQVTKSEVYYHREPSYYYNTVTYQSHLHEPFLLVSLHLIGPGCTEMESQSFPVCMFDVYYIYVHICICIVPEGVQGHVSAQIRTHCDQALGRRGGDGRAQAKIESVTISCGSRDPSGCVDEPAQQQRRRRGT